jgi:aspartate/methionine/tyrosine aminotransferase
MSTLARPLADRIQKLPDAKISHSGVTYNDATIEGAVKALDAGKTKYTNRPGIVPLRQWISGHLKEKFNVPYAPDDITVTCGGTEARFVTLKYLCAAGTHLICPGDSAIIAGAAHLAGVSIHSEIVDESKVSAVYLTPDDTNLDTLLARVVENQWNVIYEPYRNSSNYHPAQDETLRPLTISLGDLEPHAQGWRVGWMAGHAKHTKIRSYKQSMTICTPSVSQWAVLEMLEARS